MTFNELSNEDKQYLIMIYDQSKLSHQEKIDILSKRFSVVGRTIRRWWKKLGATAPNDKLPKVLREARDRELDTDADFVFVTAAQNETGYNREVFASIIKYKEFLEGKGFKVELVVIPCKYRNPTTRREYENYERPTDWWDYDLRPYLYFNKLQFGDVMISANSRVVPTAQNPLSGYEVLASGRHLILGHPRIHFKTLPRFYGDPLHTMVSTGYITYKNYSLSKAGDKGFEHHSYGFTIIEKDTPNKCLIPRPIKINSDGSFTDIKFEVTPEEVREVNSCKAYIPGDIHHEQLDHAKWGVTLDIMNKLNPEKVVLHDVLDGNRFNHHNSKDMYTQRRLVVENKYLIRDEVDAAIDFCADLQSNIMCDLKIVQSNHDDFLDRFVNEFNWKRDLHNSDAYLDYAKIQQTQNLSEHGNIFGYLINRETDAEYIPYWKGLSVSNYQIGHHGDKGINGARGSANSFARVNTKMIHGHSHSPMIKDGVTVVGVSCKLWQPYNSKGMSSWAHADSIIHNTGKNQLLVYNDSYKISNLI